ncbi:hypothetical protein WA158_007397 [Blastocystis sp. Blastoise]
MSKNTFDSLLLLRKAAGYKKCPPENDIPKLIEAVNALISFDEKTYKINEDQLISIVGISKREIFSCLFNWSVNMLKLISKEKLIQSYEYFWKVIILLCSYDGIEGVLPPINQSLHETILNECIRELKSINSLPETQRKSYSNTLLLAISLFLGIDPISLEDNEFPANLHSYLSHSIRVESYYNCILDLLKTLTPASLSLPLSFISSLSLRLIIILSTCWTKEILDKTTYKYTFESVCRVLSFTAPILPAIMTTQDKCPIFNLYIQTLTSLISYACFPLYIAVILPYSSSKSKVFIKDQPQEPSVKSLRTESSASPTKETTVSPFSALSALYTLLASLTPSSTSSLPYLLKLLTPLAPLMDQYISSSMMGHTANIIPLSPSYLYFMEVTQVLRNALNQTTDIQQQYFIYSSLSIHFSTFAANATISPAVESLVHDYLNVSLEYFLKALEHNKDYYIFSCTLEIVHSIFILDISLLSPSLPAIITALLSPPSSSSPTIYIPSLPSLPSLIPINKNIPSQLFIFLIEKYNIMRNLPLLFSTILTQLRTSNMNYTLFESYILTKEVRSIITRQISQILPGQIPFIWDTLTEDIFGKKDDCVHYCSIILSLLYLQDKLELYIPALTPATIPSVSLYTQLFMDLSEDTDSQGNQTESDPIKSMGLSSFLSSIRDTENDVNMYISIYLERIQFLRKVANRIENQSNDNLPQITTEIKTIVSDIYHAVIKSDCISCSTVSLLYPSLPIFVSYLSPDLLNSLLTYILTPCDCIYQHKQCGRLSFLCSSCLYEVPDIQTIWSDLLNSLTKKAIKTYIKSPDDSTTAVLAHYLQQKKYYTIFTLIGEESWCNLAIYHVDHVFNQYKETVSIEDEYMKLFMNLIIKDKEHKYESIFTSYAYSLALPYSNYYENQYAAIIEHAGNYEEILNLFGITKNIVENYIQSFIISTLDETVIDTAISLFSLLTPIHPLLNDSIYNSIYTYYISIYEYITSHDNLHPLFFSPFSIQQEFKNAFSQYIQSETLFLYDPLSSVLIQHINNIPCCICLYKYLYESIPATHKHICTKSIEDLLQNIVLNYGYSRGNEIIKDDDIINSIELLTLIVREFNFYLQVNHLNYIYIYIYHLLYNEKEGKIYFSINMKILNPLLSLLSPCLSLSSQYISNTLFNIVNSLTTISIILLAYKPTEETQKSYDICIYKYKLITESLIPKKKVYRHYLVTLLYDFFSYAVNTSNTTIPPAFTPIIFDLFDLFGKNEFQQLYIQLNPTAQDIYKKYHSQYKNVHLYKGQI